MLGVTLSVVSPWGEVISSTEEKEAIVYVDIDMEYLQTVRSQIPIGVQRRSDLIKFKSARRSAQ